MTKRGHPRAPYSTWKKTVWLSPECLDLLAAWRARQPGTTLSSAVETLVRLGLRQDLPTAYAAPLEAACRAAVKEEMGRTVTLLASASVDAHAAYALALLLATQGKSPDQAMKIRQTARDAARATVRLRASRKGRAELVALLTEPPGGDHQPEPGPGEGERG
jgi:hypothetical protein